MKTEEEKDFLVLEIGLGVCIAGPFIAGIIAIIITSVCGG